MFVKIIKKIVQEIIAKTLDLFLDVLSLFPSKRSLVLDRFLAMAAQTFAKNNLGYLSFDIKSIDVPSEGLLKTSYKDYSIIIQGPVVKENDFTLTTIRFYLKNYPQAQIILSTWKDSLTFIPEDLRVANVHFVLSDKPVFADDFLNTNVQLYSTQAALKCVNPSCRYLMKTRSDQRMYNPYALKFLSALLKQFPVSAIGDKLSSRLIILSDCTSLFSYGHVGDHFMFGGVQEMMLYWNCPLRPEYARREDIQNMNVFVKAEYFSEQFFGKTFLGQLGLPKEGSIADWHKVLAQLFVVIERNDLDLFWFKYRFWNYERADYLNSARAYPYQRSVYCTSPVNKYLWSMNQAQLDIPLNYQETTLLAAKVFDKIPQGVSV